MDDAGPPMLDLFSAVRLRRRPISLRKRMSLRRQTTATTLLLAFSDGSPYDTAVLRCSSPNLLGPRDALLELLDVAAELLAGLLRERRRKPFEDGAPQLLAAKPLQNKLFAEACDPRSP